MHQKPLIRELYDRAETAGTGTDPLGMDATRSVARSILDAVRDPKMHPSIAMRVARAITDGRLPKSELAEILDIIVALRTSGRVRSPGAYFMTSIKRLFQRNEIPW